MKFRKSTLYALHASTELASLEPGATVTAAEVAERYGIPVSVMAKVFQDLVRAEIAVGTRGQRGGYRLARPAAGITLLEIIDRFEPPSAAGGTPARGPDPFGARRLQRVFDEVNELVRCTYASISLETVIGGPAETTAR
jgi:Rrf2 family protein